MPGGYTGKYLDVNLTSGEFRDMYFSAEEALPYMGGKGAAALLLHRHLRPGVDPLSPENVVVINTGPLTATGTPGSSRFNLSTKSPLTGLPTNANCGGMFGMYLKRAGYDGLVLRGRAPAPEDQSPSHSTPAQSACSSRPRRCAPAKSGSTGALAS